MTTYIPTTPPSRERQVGLINVSIHGHFYQPPREDPFTGILPNEPGAAPFANYNEKITEECYRPNAEAGNFEHMSFNLGPTLATWLERAHPDVYQRILASEHRHVQRYGVSNALAQAYNHTILPGATLRDKRTQILWGLEDYRHRFGHDAQGMWLAETAVDSESLDMLAQCGVQFTVLAPWQAASFPLDTTEPYLVRLREGRTISVFFYNDLSGAVSYNDEWTADANAFASAYQRTYLSQEKCAAAIAQMHVVATDGELYGHHKLWRDKFLTHFLQRSAHAYGLEVCSLERYLQAHPATSFMEIRERSSWSCQHGIRRWGSGCECDGTTSDEQRAWKSALAHALKKLQNEADGLFEEYAGLVFHDPWTARDDYLVLRSGWEAPERFWAHHGIASRLDVGHIQMVQNLLEAQYWLQASFTSCGWFFEDLDRIEPKNNIAFARRALSLIWLATGYDLQKDFLENLQLARSWRTGRTGTDLYRALPVVPQSLLPSEKSY